MKTQILFVWQNIWKAKSVDFKLINTIIKNKNQINHFIIEKFPQTNYVARFIIYILFEFVTMHCLCQCEEIANAFLIQIKI